MLSTVVSRSALFGAALTGTVAIALSACSSGSTVDVQDEPPVSESDASDAGDRSDGDGATLDATSEGASAADQASELSMTDAVVSDGGNADQSSGEAGDADGASPDGQKDGSITDGGADGGEACAKTCGGTCADPDDPSTGCSTSSCTPIDVETNMDHCGACNHSCLGGACTDGKCAAIAVVTGLDAPQDVAVDDTNVYVTTRGSQPEGIGTGSVWKVAKTAGIPIRLASGLNNPDFIAQYRDHLYWSNNNTDCSTAGSVMRVSIAGGGSTTIKSGLRCPQDVAVDSTGVYWVTYSSAEVWTASHDGSSSTMLVSKPDQWAPLFGIAVDDSFIYFTHAADSGAALKMPKTGGAVTVLASSQQHPEGIAVDTTRVYWANTFGGSVMQAPLVGGAASALVPSGQSGATMMAIDPLHVYVSKRFVVASGSVARVDKSTKAVLELSPPLGDPRGLAIDLHYVYWVDRKGGVVWKVAK
jgi:hypothetical protein